MKKIFFLALTMFCSVTMMAEMYTIVFKSGNGSNDSGSKVSELTKIVSTATDNCVTGIVTANNIYNAGSGKGIKGGTGSAKGELTFSLNAAYNISSMTVYAASYSHKSDTAANKGFIVCGKTITWQEGAKAKITPYHLTLNQSLSEISIVAKDDKNNRWYVQKIEFEAEDPFPTTAVFETPYVLDFGSVPVEPDEPAEDVITFNIVGKHIDGDIQLSLDKKKVFSLSTSTLPAEGGDVILLYRLEGYYTAYDSLFIRAKGLDGVSVKKSMPLKISGYKYNPPSFDVDSSCMAIGPMPAFYYERAQGTQDSVLKSRLGEIIYCGVRLRYGSGALHTWDGFYKTDRDPETNQVLDMYSNEVY